MLGWLFLSFNGRIGRGIYWGATLAMFLVILVVVNAMLTRLGFYQIDIADDAAVEAVFDKAEPWLDLISLIVLWPSLAVQSKRWHDRDKSAWWLLMNFLPVVGTLWVFIELGFLRGTSGPNRFGPDPLAAR